MNPSDNHSGLPSVPQQPQHSMPTGNPAAHTLNVPQGDAMHYHRMPQAPPPPPPVPIPDGAPANHDPYAFIMSAGAPPKSKVNSGGMFKRVLIMVGIVVVIGMAFAIGNGIITARAQRNAVELRAIVAEQQEIVRIATMGQKNARSTETLNLATAAKLSTLSAEVTLQGYLTKHKVSVTPQDIAQKKDASRDKKLTEALQNNTYDETFTTMLVTMMKNYQKDLTTSYNNAGNATSKEILQTTYGSTKVLVTNFGDS